MPRLPRGVELGLPRPIGPAILMEQSGRPQLGLRAVNALGP